MIKHTRHLTQRALLTALVIAGATTMATASPPSEEVHEKSEGAAFGLSLLGTVAPIALIVGGAGFENDTVTGVGVASLFVGPSIGHWYAGRIATPGLWMRLGGAAMAHLSIMSALKAPPEGLPDTPCGGCAIGVLGGMALFAVGTVHDVVTAGRSARRWNERQLQVGPVVVGTTTRSLGLGMTGTF